MYSLDQYRATIVSCRYCPPPALKRPEALPRLKAKFHDAVARVVLDQPHMRVGIIDEDSADPYFVHLFRLDLAKHIEWSTIGDAGQLEPEYLQSMQTQLDCRFDDISNQPGWRIIVLHVAASESMEVLYVWNHPHHDGMSGKIFHQHLRRKLNEGFAQKQEPILKHRRTLQIILCCNLKTMCNHVSVVNHEYDSKVASSIWSKMSLQIKNASLPLGVVDIVWSVAARVRGEIKARLKSGLVDDWIGIMKLVSDWRTQQQGESGKTGYLSWLVTNLGPGPRHWLGAVPGGARAQRGGAFGRHIHLARDGQGRADVRHM